MFSGDTYTRVHVSQDMNDVKEQGNVVVPRNKAWDAHDITWFHNSVLRGRSTIYGQHPMTYIVGDPFYMMV